MAGDGAPSTLTRPEEYRPFTLTLSRGASGSVGGCLTITDPDATAGFREFAIRGWTRNNAVVVTGEITLVGPDPWLEDWLARLDTRTRAG